jgi:RNA polymerase sigma factor (sigma-70 family)
MAFNEFNDAKALKLLARGNELAFTHIFNKYSDEVFSRAFYFLKSEAAAQEVVQEIFMKLWVKKEAFSSIGKFDGYLMIMTKNLIMEKFDEQSRQAVRFQEFAVEYRRTLTFSNADAIEQYDKVLAAAEDLPPQTKQILYLTMVDGLRHKTIAAKLGLSVLTVKTQLQRAKKMLREKFLIDIASSLFPVFSALSAAVSANICS